MLVHVNVFVHRLLNKCMKCVRMYTCLYASMSVCVCVYSVFVGVERTHLYARMCFALSLHCFLAF